MKRTAICGFLIGVARAAAMSSFSCPPAAPNGLVYRSSCYDFDSVERTWTAARSICQSRGGRLAMVPNVDAQNWLSSTAATKFPRRQGVWLGLHDRSIEGTFYWDNFGDQDILATYFNWEREPNNKVGSTDCAYMRRSYQWRWDHVECNLAAIRVYSSICEFNALPSSVQLASRRPPTASISNVSVRLTTEANVAISPVHPDQEVRSARDSFNLKVFSAVGACVLILIAIVVALAIWKRRRSRGTRRNAAAVLVTSDTTAQPKPVRRPLEWQSLVISEVAEPFESSLKKKQVDEPTASRRSSSGNIYVDIDAFASREQSAESRSILGPAPYSRAEAEVAALPPAPPPPRRLPVAETVFTSPRALLATVAAKGMACSDIAVTIASAHALQTSSDLPVVTAAAAGQTTEGYMEFLSS